MKRSRKVAASDVKEAVDTHEEAAKKQKVVENEADLKHEFSSSVPEEQHFNGATTEELAPGKVCPYLDTVNREVLDFDFERKCSVSLLTTNVYCCLVCGKYFQGRSFNTYACKHSLEEDHHVFINMQNRRIYCLPDDYEVFDSSLSDIQHNVNPTVSVGEMSLLDSKEMVTRLLGNKQSLRGVTGMNNLHSGDAANAVLHCLIHLPMFRNYFLLESSYSFDDKPVSPLFAQLGNLTRRIWNASPWRPTVSPHELLQEISPRSEGKFGVGAKCEPLEFYSWLVNTLHRDLISDMKRRGTKRASSSAISEMFQGSILVRSESVKHRQTDQIEVTQSSSMNIDEPSPSNNSTHHASGDTSATLRNPEGAVVSRTTPFFHLQLDLPVVTLLKDEKSKTASLQVPIFTLLSKFDGRTTQFVAATKEHRTFKIQVLPQYLVFFVKRFTQNMYLIEKNHTIVNFPVDELDMVDYTEETTRTKYSLSAYICHTGDTPTGSCLARYFHKANGKWYNCQDTTAEAMLAEDHFVAEAYILFYERCI